jgi:hypothetical protein
MLVDPTIATENSDFTTVWVEDMDFVTRRPTIIEPVNPSLVPLAEAE